MPTELPRYARVNTNLISSSGVVELLESDGWIVKCLKKGITPSKYRKLVTRLLKTKAYRDPHIDDLLIFPQGTDLHDSTLVKTGKLILQDKVINK